jgi:AraC family transcriptional regulator
VTQVPPERTVFEQIEPKLPLSNRAFSVAINARLKSHQHQTNCANSNNIGQGFMTIRHQGDHIATVLPCRTAQVTASKQLAHGIGTQFMMRFPRGEWKSAPSGEDLTIAMVMSPSVSGSFDLGHGLVATRVSSGGIGVSSPNSQTHIKSTNAHEILLTLISYKELLKLCGENSGLPTNGFFVGLHSKIHHDPATAMTLQELWRLNTRGTDHGQIYETSLIMKLASNLLRLSQRLTGREKKSLAPWQEKRVVGFMNQELSKKLSLNQLATVAGLSTFHFARSFRQSFGQPPHQYLLHLRMEKAKVLLSSTRVSITAIATELGYQSTQAFARIFRKQTGMNPSDFRNANTN